MNLYSQYLAICNGFEEPSYPETQVIGCGLLASVPSFKMELIVNPVLFSVEDATELTGEDQ